MRGDERASTPGNAQWYADALRETIRNMVLATAKVIKLLICGL